jgi:hypothetical protein
MGRSWKLWAGATAYKPASATLPRLKTRCHDRQGGSTMGCLPLPVLFVLGFLIGRTMGGDQGALWGAGAGLALGLLLAGIFIVVVRRRH